MVKYAVALGKNSSLTLKVISMKLVTLFALTCPERISVLDALDIRLCSVHPEGVSFSSALPGSLAVQANQQRFSLSVLTKTQNFVRWKASDIILS